MQETYNAVRIRHFLAQYPNLFLECRGIGKLYGLVVASQRNAGWLTGYGSASSWTVLTGSSWFGIGSCGAAIGAAAVGDRVRTKGDVARRIGGVILKVE
jgi:hypothetical protein